MRKAALVIGLVGCGGESAPSADAADFVETGQFVPQLCTSGLPDCPVNVVSLDDLGGSGTIRFVAQTISSGMYLTGVEVTAGGAGLYLEHIQLVSYHLDPPLVMDAYPGVIVNLPPGGSEPLGSGTSAFVGVSTDRVAFRFGAVGPFRP